MNQLYQNIFMKTRKYLEKQRDEYNTNRKQ